MSPPAFTQSSDCSRSKAATCYYRVKHAQDSHERVVNEAQLRPAEALAPQH